MIRSQHDIAAALVRLVGALALAVVLVLPSWTHFVWAQAADELAGSGASYVTPFPPGDVYKLQVYGEGFAEGLLQGLLDAGRSLDRVDIPRKHRSIAPLVKAEVEDELKAEEQSRDAIHVALIMLGPNDRANLRSPGNGQLKLGSAAWKEQYGQRLDRLLKALKRRNVAVYLVGMPPLRRADANADAEMINEVMLERAQANGVRFLEVVESFTDENGAFSQFGTDIAGNRDKLRDGDGISFTAAGNRKLASLVATELRRDLAAARAERAVPLAGGETEQRRINPEKAATWKGVITKDGKEARPATTTVAATTSLGPQPAAGRNVGGADQRAENGRLALKLIGAAGREEAATIDIIRPAIPAAVIALLTRKDVTDAGSQPFELLADDIGDGVSVSTMVSALTDAGGQGQRKRGPSALANYATVWIKGERLPPKPGRADDFTWPRPEAAALPLPGPVALPAAAPPASQGKRPGVPDVQSQVPKARALPAAPRG